MQVGDPAKLHSASRRRSRWLQGLLTVVVVLLVTVAAVAAILFLSGDWPQVLEFLSGLQ